MDTYITTKMLSEKINVPVKTIHKWIKEGSLAGIKLPSGDYRFKEEHINNWLSRRTIKARVGAI